MRGKDVIHYWEQICVQVTSSWSLKVSKIDMNKPSIRGGHSRLLDFFILNFNCSKGFYIHTSDKLEYFYQHPWNIFQYNTINQERSKWDIESIHLCFNFFMFL